jgi:violacein biosynthesis protein VioB
MSQFELPRLYFRGKAVVNPPTGNNLVPSLADPEVDDNRLNPSRRALAEGKFGNPVLVELDTDEADRAKVIRFAEKQAYVNPGNWNYYGDFRFSFEDVTISSVVLPDGIPDHEKDGLIGARVSLRRAIMVDVDPTAAVTAQIYAESLLITKDRLLLRGHPPRHFARWFSDSRVDQPRDYLGGGAAVFQVFLDEPFVAPDPDSACLSQLEQALHDKKKSLFLQYTLFHAARRWTAEEVAEEFSHGRHPANPCALEVCGLITASPRDGLQTMPFSRCLVEEASMEKLRAGPAFAKIDPGRRKLYLDLSTTATIQPTEVGDPRGEARRDRSTRSIKLRIGPVAERTIPPTLAHLHEQGGILEYPLNDDELQAARDGTLQLKMIDGQENQRTLDETELMLGSDQRALYVERERPGHLVIAARRHGQSLKEARGILIDVVPSRMSMGKKGVSRDALEPIVRLTGPGVSGEGSWSYRGTIGPGDLTLAVQGLRPGAVHILFAPDTERGRSLHELAVRTLSGSIAAPAGDMMATVRVLPNFQRPAGAPTWAFVYREILRYYDIVYPYMGDQHFRFDVEADLRTNARQMLLRLDADPDDPTRMPPSRDMSSGKRELLREYLKSLGKPTTAGRPGDRPAGNQEEAS